MKRENVTFMLNPIFLKIFYENYSPLLWGGATFDAASA